MTFLLLFYFLLELILHVNKNSIWLSVDFLARLKLKINYVKK